MTTITVPVYARCVCGRVAVREGFVTYHRDTDSYTVDATDQLHACEGCGGPVTWETMEEQGNDA